MSQYHIIDLVVAYIAGLLTIPAMVIVAILFTNDTPDTEGKS